jgi:hypothetical protein
MTTTIKQIEAVAEDLPEAIWSVSLSAAAVALDRAAVWQRIESYIAHRWTPRDVTWIVEGRGEWTPPLTPATIDLIEVWSGHDEWQPLTLSPSPLGGYVLPGCGPYRFSGVVADGSPLPDPPAVVLEAFRRLAEYMAAKPGEAGAREHGVNIGGDLSETISRNEAWQARAMQNSGAGDLLRSYRRAP